MEYAKINANFVAVFAEAQVNNMKILFSTDRLFVREFQWEDWETVHTYAQIPEVSQYQHWGPNTEADTQEFMRQALAYQTRNPRFHYELCVCLKNGMHIGGCGIFIDPTKPTQALIGYLLHPQYWNQGFATEIVTYLLPYCREQLQLETIGATCDTRNLASQKVLEKNCFVQTARRDKDFMQKNVWRDTYRYTNMPGC